MFALKFAAVSYSEVCSYADWILACRGRVYNPGGCSVIDIKAVYIASMIMTGIHLDWVQNQSW